VENTTRCHRSGCLNDEKEYEKAAQTQTAPDKTTQKMVLESKQNKKQ